MPLVHEHLIIRADIHDAPTDEETTILWLRDLIKNLGMKIMMGPMAGYSPIVGNRGLTVAAVIETSHVVMHVWDECEPAMLQLDVYSCAPVEKQVVLDALQQFGPERVQYKFLDRDKELTTLEETK